MFNTGIFQITKTKNRNFWNDWKLIEKQLKHDYLTLSIWLHPTSSIYSVAKQTISRHFQANHSRTNHARV